MRVSRRLPLSLSALVAGTAVAGASSAAARAEADTCGSGAKWGALAAAGAGMAVGAYYYWNQDTDCLTLWEQKWAIGRTGWHLEQPHRHLVTHVDSLKNTKTKPQILVPLCGKTKDLAFLADLGFEVVGVEGAEKAVSLLSDDLQSQYGKALALTEKSAMEGFKDFKLQTGGVDITVHKGDFFSFGTPKRTFDALWDRGSLVALAPSDRPEYVKICADALKKGGRILLVAIEHDPFKGGKLGPPYSVPLSVIQPLYEPYFKIQRVDYEQRIGTEKHWKKRGATYFDEVVYLLERK